MFQSEKFWNKKPMAFLNSSSVCLNQFQCYQVSLETKVFESRGSKCSLLKSKLNFQKDFMVFLQRKIDAFWESRFGPGLGFKAEITQTVSVVFGCTAANILLHYLDLQKHHKSSCSNELLVLLPFQVRCKPKTLVADSDLEI